MLFLCSPIIGTYPKKGPVLPLSFIIIIIFKVYVDSLRNFALALQACIYHALIELTPLSLTLSLPYYSTAHGALCYIISHVDGLFQ
jgi:hypothetical protein